MRAVPPGSYRVFTLDASNCALLMRPGVLLEEYRRLVPLIGVTEGERKEFVLPVVKIQPEWCAFRASNRVRFFALVPGTHPAVGTAPLRPYHAALAHSEEPLHRFKFAARNLTVPLVNRLQNVRID